MGSGLAIESFDAAAAIDLTHAPTDVRGSHTHARTPMSGARLSFPSPPFPPPALFGSSARSYWKEVLFKKLIGHEGPISIKQLGAETGIEQYDVVSTRQSRWP